MVHLSLSDLLNLTTTADGPNLAATDHLGHILTTQLRDWLTRHGSIATVTPVVDLNRTDTVERHDPPETMATQVRLRDPHCVFPHCTRTSHDCDLDHITPWRTPDDTRPPNGRAPDGRPPPPEPPGPPPGATTPDNLAPLCRRHHLVKTAGRWRYQRNPDGTYTWTSRHGRTLLVVPASGTIDITEEAD